MSVTQATRDGAWTGFWTSLRPEKIGAFASDAKVPVKHAHIDGEIKMISYQGAATRFSVEAKGTRIVAEVPADATRFNQGDSVRLIWPQSAMVTMEDDA